MRLGAIALAIAAVGLAACSETMLTGKSSAPRQPVPLADRDAEAVKAAVRFKLRDPPSALFDRLVAGKSADGRVFVCGWVNSRNGFGGYTGGAPFAVELVAGSPVVRVVAETNNWISRAEAQDLCGSLGDYYKGDA